MLDTLRRSHVKRPCRCDKGDCHDQSGPPDAPQADLDAAFRPDDGRGPAGGGILGGLSAVDEDGSNGLITLVTGVFALGVGIGALWFCFVYWKRLDEAAREAHKFAWYWGGSLGLAVSGLLIGLLARGADASTLLWPGFDADATGYLMTGALAVVIAQLVGYVLVWAGWWLWKGR